MDHDHAMVKAVERADRLGLTVVIRRDRLNGGYVTALEAFDVQGERVPPGTPLTERQAAIRDGRNYAVAFHPPGEGPP